MRRMIFGLCAVLGLMVLTVTACSDDDSAPVDVAAALDEDGAVHDATTELLGEEPSADAHRRAGDVGTAIASVPGEEDGNQRVRLTGRVLALTATSLAEQAADGDAERRATLEFALALGAAATDGRGLDPEQRVTWLLPADTDADLRAATADAFGDADFADLAERLTDETDLSGGSILDQLIDELAGVIPASTGDDRLTAFLQGVGQGR